jgi:uncharacterized protein (TIGR02996 family)
MSDYARDLDTVLKYMNDGEALLRAVDHDPREEVPAGALADWHDENGQPEVAKIIRQHIETHREGADYGYGQANSRLEQRLAGLREGQGGVEILPPSHPRPKQHPLILTYRSPTATTPHNYIGWEGHESSRVKAWKTFRELVKKGLHPIATPYMNRLRSEHAAETSGVWSSSKHKSGVGVLGRHLQNVARNSTDPLMWVHALEALHPKEPNDKYGEAAEYYHSPEELIPHALRELHKRQSELSRDPVQIHYDDLADALEADLAHKKEHGYGKLKASDIDRIALRKK